MIKIAFIILLVLLGMFGCAPPHERHCALRADARFDETERALIEKSVRAWEEASNGMFYIDISYGEIDTAISPDSGNDNGIHEMFKASRSDAVIKELEDRLGTRIRGYADLDSPEDLFIVTDVLDEDSIGLGANWYRILFARTVMHELGHHWGLEHSHKGEPRRLMTQSVDPEFSDDLCIKSQDVVSLCQQYDCGEYKIRPALTCISLNDD